MRPTRDQGVRGHAPGAVGPLAHLREAGGLHAGVDGAQFGAVGAAGVRQLARVGVAGRDERGPAVDLGGQRAVEGREQRPYRGDSSAAEEAR